MKKILSRKKCKIRVNIRVRLPRFGVPMLGNPHLTLKALQQGKMTLPSCLCLTKGWPL